MPQTSVQACTSTVPRRTQSHVHAYTNTHTQECFNDESFHSLTATYKIFERIHSLLTVLRVITICSQTHYMMIMRKTINLSGSWALPISCIKWQLVLQESCCVNFYHKKNNMKNQWHSHSKRQALDRQSQNSHVSQNERSATSFLPVSWGTFI